MSMQTKALFDLINHEISGAAAGNGREPRRHRPVQKLCGEEGILRCDAAPDAALGRTEHNQLRTIFFRRLMRLCFIGRREKIDHSSDARLVMMIRPRQNRVLRTIENLGPEVDVGCDQLRRQAVENRGGIPDAAPGQRFLPDENGRCIPMTLQGGR